MPGKARRRKVKYSAPKKRKKERTSHPTVLYEQSRVTETRKPVSPSISASVASAPEPMPKPALIQHPYISNELRTISILAGIMLVILIILAIVMS